MFLQTTDGGTTWVNQPVPDVRCLQVKFADPTHGYAVCLNTQRQSQVVVWPSQRLRWQEYQK